MLNIGGFAARDCGGVTRRCLLSAGAALPWVTGLLGPVVTRGAASAPRAKSVLLIWLNGGPSHLDLFDPKPAAPDRFRGPFGAIATRTPGVQFSELLPQLAARSDKFSVIRSNINHHGGHRQAGSIALSGYVSTDGGEPGGKAEGYQPSFGSILARHRGDGDLPSFISLAPGPIGDLDGPMIGQGGGAWGKRYDPFRFNCNADGDVSIPELNLLEGISPARLADRRLVLKELDHLQRRLDLSDVEKWGSLQQQAYRLLTSIGKEAALDLSVETEETRTAYGSTSFGQSCLLGRRLVEAGVPYVQVNWSQFVEVLFPKADYGWDTHSDNFGLLADWHGPLLDRVLSVLLDDLQQRALLETTLVVAMGEFGRTPRINNIGSRDHWPHCYFSVWAGGGVQPGRVVGASDLRGEHPVTDPVTPEMVGTTMMHLAGMGQQARAEMNVLQDGRVIEDLL
tara:strand:- start:959 stop:2317 length:1359 start_codon:yes stop_codon:yes gene_type:complete